MTKQYLCTEEKGTPAFSSQESPSFSLAFFDTLLPCLQGLAALGQALSLALHHGTLTGARAGDAVQVLAQQLATAHDLLARWKAMQEMP